MRKNRSRLRKLADAIEQKTLPVGFNMRHFAGNENGFLALNKSDEIPCGTTCCIAGWAVLLFGKGYDIVNGGYAQNILGLSDDDSERLFFNAEDYVSKKPLEAITRREAVAAIRRMAEE